MEFLRDARGYVWLGNWHQCPDNRNVEQDHLSAWLQRQGHGERVIGKVLFELDNARQR